MRLIVWISLFLAIIDLIVLATILIILDINFLLLFMAF